MHAIGNLNKMRALYFWKSDFLFRSMKVHVFALHVVFINELVTSRSLVCMLKSLKFFLSWKCNFLGGALMHVVNRIITARSLVYIFQNLKFLSSWKCDFVAGACMCACFYIRCLHKHVCKYICLYAQESFSDRTLSCVFSGDSQIWNV